MASAKSKRISHGLTLPQSGDGRNSVVNNILSSLATLDETAQLQWVQETSRQVDLERQYQRHESLVAASLDHYNENDETVLQIPVTGVGYRGRGSGNTPVLPFANPSAPSPAIPMGRSSKGGFFRRFMGIGPKVQIENDLMISTQQPAYNPKAVVSVQVRDIKNPITAPQIASQPNIDESRPGLIKKKSSNFFRRRPKSAGDSSSKHTPIFTSNEPLPPLPTILDPLSLPQASRQGSHQLNELRQTLESYGIPNGPSKSRGRSQTSPYREPATEVRPEPIPEPMTNGVKNHVHQTLDSIIVPSSEESQPPDSGKYAGRPLRQEKAKQVMGMNTKKSLSPVLKSKVADEVNVAAAEPEFQDVGSPRKHTFDDSADIPRENGESMDEDRVKETARDIFHGTELLVSLAEAPRWLMSTREYNSKVRIAYMELFDFMGLDILMAVRRLCGRLFLKGESQQLDRLLEALAKRWYECNPESGMKDPDIVHALSYSIFLLNTDLHIVDISSSQRMTRSQFVRNTMHTILTQRPSNKRIATEPVRSQPQRGKLTTFPSASSPNLSHLVSSPNLARSGSLLKVSQAVGMARNPSAHSLENGNGRRSKDSARTPAERLSWSLFDEKIGPFGGMAALGSQSAWEGQMENHLKDIYQSLKQMPLQQAQTTPSNDSSLSMNLKPVGLGLSRNPSILSQASHHSDSGSTAKYGTRSGGRDWLGRSRSQPRLPLHAQDSHVSIRSDHSSVEDRVRSPPNSAQKHRRSTSHGRSPSSRSIDSFIHDTGPSIGFANSLSHTIIREEHSPSHAYFDEELQEHALILSGPPWAKEGVVKSKRHLDSNSKKSKDKGWTESFAVIDKGQMRLFQFDSHPVKHTSRLGGGNWQQNANMIGSFLLRQTLASALPSPGYSKSRQYVWALTLPSGAVYFFEAGTSDLVKEWVESANYWAARTSKEPLKAGVSNMEWGWGNCIAISEDEVTDDGESASDGRRSTLEVQRSPTINGKATAFAHDPRNLKGDKAVIRDWRPPQPTLMASSLKEREQLEALEAFAKQLEEEFTQHNDIRTLMLRSFTPRHPNSVRALANWERKSQYLLREIVRHKTYVEVLSRALGSREELIKKANTSQRETQETPEPWFDIRKSLPNSVGTEDTRGTKVDKDEPVASG